MYDLLGAVPDTGRSLTAILLFIEQDGIVLRGRISACCNESLDVLSERFEGLAVEHEGQRYTEVIVADVSELMAVHARLDAANGALRQLGEEMADIVRKRKRL